MSASFRFGKILRPNQGTYFEFHENAVYSNSVYNIFSFNIF